MSFTVRGYKEDDLPALRQVLRDPAIVAQFDMFEGEDGAERLLGDPYTPAEGVSLAFVGDEPAGFACAILIPSVPPWSMLRGGVAAVPADAASGARCTSGPRVTCATQTRLAGVTTWRPPPGNRTRRLRRVPRSPPRSRSASATGTTAGSG
jgi:hypothetical protein